MKHAPEVSAWIRAALRQFEEPAKTLINSNVSEKDFKEDPVVKLILSGREVLARIEEEEGADE